MYYYNWAKMRNQFWYTLKMYFFQYYSNNNIGLFSISSHIVIALSTIATQLIVVALFRKGNLIAIISPL